MLMLHGKAYSKAELYRYCSNIDQLASISEATLIGGRSAGMRVYNFNSASGLAFSVLPDKCMDIGALSYNGVNMSLLTRNGLCAASHMHPAEGEFDRYFSGGMLWTCGFKNCGPSYTDESSHFHHLHGRLGTLPAENTWKSCGYEDGEYVLRAGGKVRDAVLEGHNLVLERTIRTTLSSAQIEITDVVENLDINATEYLLLYHFNFGFPFVAPELKLGFPEAQKPPKPRTEAAREQLELWQSISAPQDGIEENVFFHFPKPDKEQMIRVSLQNPYVGVGVELCYDSTYLPYLVEWKCMRSSEYALGIEPSNNLIAGMEEEKLNNRAKLINPGERHVVKLKLSFYKL